MPVVKKIITYAQYRQHVERAAGIKAHSGRVIKIHARLLPDGRIEVSYERSNLHQFAKQLNLFEL